MLLEIVHHRRKEICVSKKCDDCPVLNVVKQLRKGDSMTQAKKLCEENGLKPANQVYGSSFADKNLLKEIEETVFTADCKKGIDESSEFINCGSIMIKDTNEDNSELDIKQDKSREYKAAAELLRMYWVKSIYVKGKR